MVGDVEPGQSVGQLIGAPIGRTLDDQSDEVCRDVQRCAYGVHVTTSTKQGRSMRIVRLEVQGLRSIASASLEDCGDFNVLIGQNNAGKSNLLAGLDLAMGVLAHGVLATHSSPLVRDVDFHDRRTATPVRLAVTLRPEAQFLSGLLAQVGEDFPQVRNAVPADGEFDLLRVQTVYELLPTALAYIESVRLGKEGEEGAAGPILLEVPRAAAVEVAARLQRLGEAGRDLTILKRFLETSDVDDLARLRERRVPTPTMLRELSSERENEIRRAVLRSEDGESARASIRDTVGALEAVVADADDPLSENIGTFAGYVNRSPSYVEALLQRLSEVRLLHLADRRQQIGADEAQKLLQLKVSRDGGAVLRTIQDTVNTLLGVEIDAFQGQRAEASRDALRRLARLPAEPVAELDVDKFLVQANGSGIREALRLVLDVEFQKPEIILVEEPEVHLHPALEIAMMRHLQTVSRTAQVFLTTHSTNFLDTGDMRNVYLVSRREGTQVQHVSLNEAEVELPKELGLRLSSVFMYDRLIFVEGTSDEAVLREFAQTLDLNLGQANVGFVIMGGSRNFTHYAAEATMSLLGKRRVKSLFILDRDEKASEDMGRLTGRLSSKASLHVLQSREIENYLVDPQSMSEFITAKAARAGLDLPVPSAQEVAAAIEEVAENLKGVAVAKRVAAALCRPLYPDRQVLLASWEADGLATAAARVLSESTEALKQRQEDVEGEVQRAQAQVDSDWPSQRLAVVPGHELLDGVIRRYGLRFRKERDAAELAALIPRGRISRELSDLLKGFCQSDD